MPAFTRGGTTPPIVLTPIDWPPGWPPQEWDDDGEEENPWPPGWPRLRPPFTVRQEPKLVLTSDKDGVLFVTDDSGPPPETKDVTIGWTLDITQPNDDPFTDQWLSNHVVLVRLFGVAGDQVGGAALATIAVTGDGVTQMTGELVVTIDRPVGANTDDYRVTATVVTVDPVFEATVDYYAAPVTLAASAGGVVCVPDVGAQVTAGLVAIDGFQDDGVNAATLNEV